MNRSAIYLINELNRNNYEAYLVGGCVRDMLLDQLPNDWDICTSAFPEEVLKIFEKKHIVFKKGIKHGTVGVIVDDEVFEITTFRIDKEYSDHRRPSKVEFTSSLREDLSRRDFTINALACDKSGQVIDYFSGKEDLNNKLIRAVGNPEIRFEEDALRILRAIRLAVQLNFSIEEKTYLAISNKKNLLEKISFDRKREELNKMILSKKPSTGIKMLAKLELLNFILPELSEGIEFEQNSPFHTKTVFDHTMDVLDNTENIKNLRLAALLHDIAKPRTYFIDKKGIGHFYGHNSIGSDMTKEIMKRLNYSKSDILQVSNLVKYHMAIHDIQSKASVKRLIRKIGIDSIELLIKLYMADKSATLDKSNNEILDNFIKIFNEIIDSEEPMNIKDMKIDGNDLIDMGYKPGPKLGKTLRELFNIILEDPDKNNRENLLRMAKSKLG